MAEHEPLKVFYSYSHKDENYRKDLDNHLSGLIRKKLIETWCDLRIIPGASWQNQIINRIETSDIILFLVSANFLASDYCYSEEMERAIKRHMEGKAKVVPIYVRPVYRKELPFEQLLSLPNDAKPVESWASPDEAWVSVVEGIHKVIHGLNAEIKRNLAISQASGGSSKQNFSNFSDTSTVATNFHQKFVAKGTESSKSTPRPGITESSIDARAQRLKSIANRRDISREDADAAIEEIETWLIENKQDTNIRQIYLSLVEKKATPIQVQKALQAIETWLSENQNNTNIRTQYIILVTRKTDIDKANLVIKETEHWIKYNRKKDESLLIAYLGLIEKWGTLDQFQDGVSNVESWCPKSSQSTRLKEKLSKLHKRIEKVGINKNYQNITKLDSDNSWKMLQFNIDTFAHRLSHLAIEGTLDECKIAIEETQYWLNRHPEDTNIRQVYLKLVGKDGIDNILVQKALEDAEIWLLEKKHDSNTSVRQAYLRLIRNRGTLTQRQKALKDTEMWLRRYDSAHIRDAYGKLLQEMKDFED